MLTAAAAASERHAEEQARARQTEVRLLDKAALECTSLWLSASVWGRGRGQARLTEAATLLERHVAAQADTLAAIAIRLDSAWRDHKEVRVCTERTLHACSRSCWPRPRRWPRWAQQPRRSSPQPLPMPAPWRAIYHPHATLPAAEGGKGLTQPWSYRDRCRCFLMPMVTGWASVRRRRR
jgi:hypothetical protein